MDDVECSSQAAAICEKGSYLQDQNGNAIQLSLLRVHKISEIICTTSVWNILAQKGGYRINILNFVSFMLRAIKDNHAG